MNFASLNLIKKIFMSDWLIKGLINSKKEKATNKTKNIVKL